MLFNTSYKNEDYVREVNSLVGKSYSFIEKLKMQGVGSRRLVIEELSPLLKPKNMQEIDANFASVELRPTAIFSTQTFSIHSNGQFIKLRKDKYYRDNKKFFDKMNDLKIAFLNMNYKII